MVFAAPLAGAKPRQRPEPPIAIPTPELEAAFHCHGEIESASSEPLLFVTGTGTTGEQAYLIGKAPSTPSGTRSATSTSPTT
jgi:hypothetical protein